TVVPAPTETYERYYAVNLGAGASYVPAENGFFAAGLFDDYLRAEIQGTAWGSILSGNNGADSVIGDGANLKFTNTDDGSNNLVVMRLFITGATYERYYYGDLALDAAYIPTDEGLYTFASPVASIIAQYKNNGTWLSADRGAGNVGNSLAIGDGTNLRIFADYSAGEIVLMRWVL
ncbi:unnamed protein product, partial [marine sediment metagenome]